MTWKGKVAVLETPPGWRHNDDGWPGDFIDMPFQIRQSALIIVDMQRYFVDPGGPFGAWMNSGYPRAFDYFYGRLTGTVIPNLTQVLANYRHLALPVIHVTFGPNRSTGDDLSPTILRRWAMDGGGTGGWNLIRPGSEWRDVIPELAPDQDEIVVNKTGRSAFTSTGIDQALRGLGVREVLVGGWATNGCVEMTARDAVDRGYETFLLEDGCATFTEEAHINTLRTFARVDGSVITLSQTLHDSGKPAGIAD